MLRLSSFYFPRRLGRSVAKARHRTRSGCETYATRRSGGETYETWREGIERQDVTYVPIDEATLRERLLREHATSTGFILVIGEPGAGKSRLLDEWISKWAQSEPAPRLGVRVPVLVRCRDLAPENLGGPDELADRFWERRAPMPPDAMKARSFHEQSTGRVWEALWLIDGLDELPDGLLDDSLCRRIAALPGRACVTCRTAVAHDLRRTLEASGAVQEQVELLPLDPHEQLAFLTACLGGDQRSARTLHERVKGNLQLREIASSALLLELIAEVGEGELQAVSRAKFYAGVVRELWKRRVKGAAGERLRPYRDVLLTALAGRIRLDAFIAPIEELDRTLAQLEPQPPDDLALVEALRATGMLRLEGEKVEFIHLALQLRFSFDP